MDKKQAVNNNKDLPSKEVTDSHSNNTSALRRIIPILFFLFLAFCIFAVIMRLKNPNITLFSMLKFSNPLKKDVIKPRTPKLIEAEKVTKKISAKEGGFVEVTSKNGYTYRLVIQPDIYTTDPAVSLTPLEEAPFEYPSAGSGQVPPAPPPDPGVDVTIDPPNPPNPPEPPNPPGPPNDDEPDDPTPGDDPTGIEIYVFPRRPTRILTTGDGQAANPNQIAADIMRTAGLGNIIDIPQNDKAEEMTATPSNNSGGRSAPRVLIFTGRTGPVHILPIYPVWGNGGGNDPPEGGDETPPDGTGAPIDGDGTITPDDPDGTKGDDQEDQAAGNSGGRCSAEFIAAVMSQYADAGASGQDSAANRYGALLDECEKEILGYIKRLCQSDRRFLRRNDFTTARMLLGQTQATPEVQSELNKLEESCKGYYTMTDGGDAPKSGEAGVYMKGTIDAFVCGYFDDVWKSKTTYTLTVEGTLAHSYEGNQSFRLPPRGGSFSGIDKTGNHNFAFAPAMGALLPTLGFTGDFDSAYTVNVVLYPMVKLKIAIPLFSKDCTPGVQIPPLAPLPK